MNIKSNFAVKFIAVILFAVFLTATVLSSACLVFGMASGAFVPKSKLKDFKQELMQSMMWSPLSEIRHELKYYTANDEGNGIEFYGPSYISENFLYEIKNADGTIVFSNIDTDAGFAELSDEVVFREYKTINNEKESTEQANNTEETTTFPTEYYDEYDDEFYDESYEKVYTEKSYSITVVLKEELSVKDGFYYVGYLFDYVAEHEALLSFVAIISAVLSVVLFVFLMCASGHKSNVDGIHISRFDRFSIDILTAVYAGLTVLLGMGIAWTVDETLVESLSYYNAAIGAATPFFITICVIGVIIDFILLAILSMTAAVRLKTRTFIKSTLIFMVLKSICKLLKKVFTFTGKALRTVPFVWKTVLLVGAVFLFETIALCFFEPAVSVFAFFINIIIGICVIAVAVMLKNIKKGTEEIARGNLYKKINTKYMFLDIKDHAENINNINDGIAKAVEERMKSERFKTELITNVSHDIKTPLTSIINYVDLLEKEEISNEKAQEYLAVLSRQSARLKKLIEDLIEASKASTGNLNVNLSKFELGILLSQALGEYEERFEKSNLQVVLNTTDDMLFVMADNRHMWRVFDNILNNIAKYAQPNTRIYIDTNRKNQIAEISFKNISKNALNISGDELMERFVRGDSSRNTEGSGLGLSIAKSLTEVQKGKLDIQIDGDLFKVRLAFPLSE